MRLRRAVSAAAGSRASSRPRARRSRSSRRPGRDRASPGSAAAAPRLHQHQLRREQRALRVERVEVARRAGAVAQVGQPVRDRERVCTCAACARNCSPSVARPASASATSRKAVWIERSYCATAMSRLTLANVEVGLVAAGVEDRLQQLRRSGDRPRSALEQARELGARRAQPFAVSEMCGKNAARAAPMLALAANSCCSAARMSGRRASSSDGKPGRQLVGHLLAGRAAAAAGRSAGSPWPTQQDQRVLVERALPQRLRQRDARAFEQRLRLAEVELATTRRSRSAAWSGAYDSSRVASVWRVTLEQLVVGGTAQARRSRPSPTRLICAALRPSAVARYCASAASLRHATRPNRSSS